MRTDGAAGAQATRCTWSRKLVRRYLGNGVLMLLWFGISSTIILVIKVLVSGVPAFPAASLSNHTTPPPAPATPALFPYPLTITTAIQVLVGITAFVASRIPYCTVISPTRQQILHFALPIGVLTSVEIGGTNYALKILHFSFAQILKAAGPFFVLIFALMLGLEKFRCELLLSLVCICGGLAVATLGEVEVKGWGMLISLGAAAAGGLKWALVQIILQGGVENQVNRTAGEADVNGSAPELMMEGDERMLQTARGGSVDSEIELAAEGDDSSLPAAACPARHGGIHAEGGECQRVGHDPARPTKMSPLGTILCTAPVSFVVLLPLACALEGAGVVGRLTCWSSGEGCPEGAGKSDLMSILTVSGLVLASSVLVFVLLIVEYILVHNTSSLAVSIASIFKELTAVGAGMLVLSDKVSAVNLLGFMTSQLGIVMYTVLKYRQDVAREPVAPATAVVTVSLPSPSEALLPVRGQGGGAAGTQQYVPLSVVEVEKSRLLDDMDET